MIMRTLGRVDVVEDITKASVEELRLAGMRLVSELSSQLVLDRAGTLGLSQAGPSTTCRVCDGERLPNLIAMH